MSSEGDFLAAVEPLREARRAGKDMRCSRALRGYWQLAEQLGMAVLARYRRELDEDDRRDLIQDLLATKLEALVMAEKPHAYFVVCVTNKGKDELKRRARQARPVDPARFEGNELHGGVEQQDHAFVADALATLASASPRDRAIATAVGYGEEEEDIGRHYGISTGAVYKIMDRLRKRMKAGEP